MNNTLDNASSPRLHRAVTLVKRTIVVSAVVLFALWMAASYIPTWYLPPSVADSDIPRIRASVPNTYQAFTDRIVRGERFTFDLHAATINEWITARDTVWPESRNAVPPQLHGPVVAFECDRIIFAARIRIGPLQSILSAHLDVALYDREVIVRLHRLSVGALPVPLSVVPDDVHRLVNAFLDRAAARRFRSAADHVRSAGWRRAFKDGVEFTNRFLWSNGDRDFRIIHGQCRAGTLTLTIDPV